MTPARPTRSGPRHDGPDAPAGHPRPRQRVSAAERTLIIGLAARGLTKAAIARETHRSLNAIDRVLDDPAVRALQTHAATLKDDVLSTLQAHATEFIQDWKRASKVGSRRGRHEPARDALIASRLVDPLHAAGTPSFTVVVGIQSTDLAGLPLAEAEAVIEASRGGEEKGEGKVT